MKVCKTSGRSNPLLAAGLILNALRLLCANSAAESWLAAHWGLSAWFWHFLGGLACALMLAGLLRMARGDKGCPWHRRNDPSLGGN